MKAACFSTWFSRTLCWWLATVTWCQGSEDRGKGAAGLWSLQPLAHVTPPQIQGHGWGEQAVDRFVFDKLRRAGLGPGPAADRRTLIRRATMDLTGLLPTPAEVDAFVNDGASFAYERLIDRLLASPHYGEHWARHWLDVARYSDTKGYVYAREEKRWIHAWVYRDWVAKSLNDDMPYDQFVRLQIAADQIVPEGSPDLAAMGFLTLGRRFLGVTHDIIDDRIDVITRGMLGLTVACARCHDHKYDPISAGDYYSLYGVFQSSAETVARCGESRDEAFLGELRQRESKLNETMALRREEQASRVRARVREYLLAQLELEKYPEEAFGQILGPEDLNPVVVRRWQGWLERDRQGLSPVFPEWHRIRIEGDAKDLSAEADRIAVRLSEVEERWQRAPRATPQAGAMPDPQEERLRLVLHGPESPGYVPDEHIANIEMYFPTGVVVELWKLQGEVDRLLLDSPGAAPHAMVLRDRPVPSMPRIFLRGNPASKGEVVPRRFLQALARPEAKPFARGSGRLELAEAIADPSNPLTARVMVNRVWMHHFGNGLVNTPSDFGARAEQPSHPELLDWLSRRFIDSGWSLKELHRQMMLSQAYRQSVAGAPGSALTETSMKVDPENRLLWRMTSHRLSFEEARDAWLAVSGELDPQVGGRPEALFGKSNLRRTLYALVDRENLPAVLRTFDFANPDLSIARRDETTVPQQALFGLNHPFIAGRAKRIVAAISTADERAGLRHLYRLLFQREPSVEELAQGLEFLGATEPSPSPLASTEAWSYGYGEIDPADGRIKNFEPLPDFNGTSWQGGENFPDARLGWLQLTAEGGHPGNDLKHAVVRRWTAPTEGRYLLESTLVHEPKAGDGIRAFVTHSRKGKLHEVLLHGASAAITLEGIVCQAGETLDFTVDIHGGLNSDQFLWAPKLRLLENDVSGNFPGAPIWDAQKDFSHATHAPLSGWEQLVQVLMLSNEFLFID